MRSRGGRATPTIVAAAAAAIATTTIGLGGCRSNAPPPGVTDLRIEQPKEHHVREGFVQLVPPTHIPSSSPERDQVEIWMKLPEDSPIEVQFDDPQRPSLRFAPGTWADRVEFVGRGDARRIVDIRGTRIEPDGSQTFYVLRPTAPNPTAALVGVQWARDDTTAHAAATERMVAVMAELPSIAAMKPERRQRVLDSVAAKNGCAGCHGIDRPDNASPGQHGIVDRGTDASGFFTPRTVLWDEVALEAYGAHDRSWDDPAIEVRCGGQAVVGEPGQRRCADGSIATGRLQWDASKPVAKAHLQQVCESRATLFAHMTRHNRVKLAQAAGPCEKR